MTVTNLGAQSGTLANGFTYSAVTTISYVQGNAAVPQTAQASVTIPFTAAQAAGDLNVIAVGWNDSTATVSTITDNSGNSYMRAVGPTVHSGVASQSIYNAKNIVAAAAGANVVTVTFSTAAKNPDIRILEYKGADPNNPVDVSAAGSGISAISSSGSVTTTNATDLLFGANLVQTETAGPGSGFITRLLTSPDNDIAEDEMVTSIGSYSATAPLSSGQWIMQMVAFRTPSGVTTPPTAPGNLTATAASASQVNLSWTASTSNGVVANYIMQRCQGSGCTNFAQNRDTGWNQLQRYRSVNEYELQLPGAGRRYGREPERVFQHLNRYHTSCATPDSAEQSDGGGNQREPNQSELDGLDKQRGAGALYCAAMPRCRLH